MLKRISGFASVDGILMFAVDVQAVRSLSDSLSMMGTAEHEMLPTAFTVYTLRLCILFTGQNRSSHPGSIGEGIMVAFIPGVKGYMTSQNHFPHLDMDTVQVI